MLVHCDECSTTVLKSTSTVLPELYEVPRKSHRTTVLYFRFSAVRHPLDSIGTFKVVVLGHGSIHGKNGLCGVQPPTSKERWRMGVEVCVTRTRALN